MGKGKCFLPVACQQIHTAVITELEHHSLRRGLARGAGSRSQSSVPDPNLCRQLSQAGRILCCRWHHPAPEPQGLYCDCSTELPVRSVRCLSVPRVLRRLQGRSLKLLLRSFLFWAPKLAARPVTWHVSWSIPPSCRMHCLRSPKEPTRYLDTPPPLALGL